MHRTSRRATAAALLAAGVVAGYLAFLGWDQHKDVDAAGNASGPYQAWQVVGYGVLLAGLAFGAGRRGYPWVATVTISAVLTICFAVDAATDADADGLWPIGAALVAIGSAAGAAGVAAMGAFLRPRRGLQAG
ncbi:hypothetical protein [Phytohabitans aurantiacus]|jgi:hypothetical protein|uniref:Integral membrane protein n=1 Tax=Phytohabitans aurantiacus TaxID=3016789 RepID=A0ABQ5R5I5_9ACTN|nr:hypothetical protein [Phytohabitans aurantiacus]GLI01447.1 hypothetical protein Pa4123_67230 [Phytohabitans aurantiacus]